MIKITNTETYGWEAAIRGMRNPMNSWAKSDSYWTHIENPQTENTANYQYFVGDNDVDLMRRLVAAGSDHSKFMRMLTVTADITAPRYWWTEYDTYKVGTVANSCSTMHKIHAKDFEWDDFSTEHLDSDSVAIFGDILDTLNNARDVFLQNGDKNAWWQLIQLLPQSYNQLRTVQLNYAVLKNMYHARKHHKLDEWHDFCRWVESLPYSYLIVGDNHVD